MKHCVGIFARDESLKLGCDNEQDQEAWLQTLFNVYMNTKCGTPEEHLRQNYGQNVEINLQNTKNNNFMH